jgi:hypothetical protein
MRTADFAPATRRGAPGAFDAGHAEVKHPGHPYYSLIPGGQVLTIAPAS